jgi:hypothetical protein
MRRDFIACVGVLSLWLAGCANCVQVQEDAQALRDELSRCGAGDTCQKVDFSSLVGANNCLAAFQCTGAFNATANLSDFQRRARVLSETAKTCGGSCAIASCVDPSQLDAVCNTQLGQCELVPHNP